MIGIRLQIDFAEILAYCRTVLPFPSYEHGELELDAGDLILLTDRQPNGVDDGWWAGYHVSQGLVGCFPSAVVEEISGADLSAEDLRLLKSLGLNDVGGNSSAGAGLYSKVQKRHSAVKF